MLWNLNDIVGTIDLENKLGVNATTLRRWTNLPGFPKPLPCRVNRKPVYSYEAVHKWYEVSRLSQHVDKV